MMLTKLQVHQFVKDIQNVKIETLYEVKDILNGLALLGETEDEVRLLNAVNLELIRRNELLETK